jgi:predicted TPR repeat methyltransferase
MNQTTQQAPIAPNKTKEQWFNKGLSHFHAQQYKKAIADYDSLLQLDPQDFVAKTMREDAMRLMEKLDAN